MQDILKNEIAVKCKICDDIINIINNIIYNKVNNNYYKKYEKNNIDFFFINYNKYDYIIKEWVLTEKKILMNK